MDPLVFEKITKKLVKRTYAADDTRYPLRVRVIPTQPHCECGHLIKELKIISFTKKFNCRDEVYWKKKCESCKQTQNFETLTKEDYKQDFIANPILD
jgi:hypothetical protein